MIDTPHSSIVVGEVRDQDQKYKRLFSGHHLSFLNKATKRHRNNRKTDFYWLPWCHKSSLRTNEWATEEVYLHGAEIQYTNGWHRGYEIRGPVIIKRSEIMLPSVTIGAKSKFEEEKRETAGGMLKGFWHIAESPYTNVRQLFTQDRTDLIKGRLIFG